MPGLTVPAPVLDFRPAPPGRARAEDALRLRLPPVLLPDGREFDDTVPGASGYFLYRLPISGTPAPEVWNEEARQWVLGIDTVTAAMKPRPLIYRAGHPLRWEGIFVAAGDKAVEINAREYCFRAYFRAFLGGNTLDGFSPPTPALRFVPSADVARAGVRMTPDLDSATELELFLRTADGQIVGSVNLAAAAGQVVLSNQGGASVSLRYNGDIELRPASGGNVIVTGPLQAERILYRPDDAPGSRQWLNRT